MLRAMLNRIWLGLLLVGVVLAGINNRFGPATEMALGNAGAAVNLSIGLVGVMTLWLGLMRLAEKSGLVSTLARGLRPLLVRLFPDVPADHPAMGSMLLNLAANLLGLNNAATPLGLRAMRDLESLNRRPGTATDAMCTLLALNTGGVQLVPVGAIALLAAQGSHNPTAIIGTTLLTTATSATIGLVTVKLLARLPWFRLGPVPAAANGQATPTDPASSAEPPAAAPETTTHRPWGTPAVVALALFFAFVAVRFVAQPDAAEALRPVWLRTIDALSLLAVPFLLSFFPLHAAARGIAVYSEFIEGAKEGFQTSVRIIPYLVGMLVAIGFLRGSGGIDLLGRVAAPLLGAIGYPPELLPMTLLRPLTGSGALAALGELAKTHGPDSLLARTGATLYGGTETTFYVIAVYFGSVGIRRTRHAVWAGLAADAGGALAAVIACRWVFGK